MSVGEIFDRALTVYVKQWRRFSLLAVILCLPKMWINYVRAEAKGQSMSAAASPKTAPSMDQLLTVMFGTAYQHNYVVISLSIAVSILITLAVYPAFVRGVRSVDEDRTLTLAENLAPGLSRFGRLLGVAGLWVLIFLGLGVTVGTVFVPAALLGAIFGRIGLVLGFVYIGCLVIAFIVVAIGLAIAFDWSLFIATDEDKAAGVAVRESIGRALRRGRFWRTIGVALGLTVLGLVVGVVFDAANSSLFLWTKSALLYSGLNYLISLPFAAYSGLVIAIYFLDSRLRDTAVATPPVR